MTTIMKVVKGNIFLISTVYTFIKYLLFSGMMEIS